jgi:hypothetical protein
MHTYVDADDRPLEVGADLVPGRGPVIHFLTDPEGCTVPLADLPVIVARLQELGEVLQIRVAMDPTPAPSDPGSST